MSRTAAARLVVAERSGWPDRQLSTRRCTPGRLRDVPVRGARRDLRRIPNWPLACAPPSRPSARDEQLLNFVTSRYSAPRTQPPAVERRDGVGIPEHVFHISLRRTEACGRKPAAECIAGAGGIQAVDGERWRAELAPSTAGETAF